MSKGEEEKAIEATKKVAEDSIFFFSENDPRIRNILIVAMR
jgi:hypothetical protein